MGPLVASPLAPFHHSIEVLALNSAEHDTNAIVGIVDDDGVHAASILAAAGLREEQPEGEDGLALCGRYGSEDG